MRQLVLTPRLQAVASLVPPGSRLADIGTDHAYLPVWLLKAGSISRAIAADLREGPLSRARSTAAQYDCSEQMEFRLCDGLTGIRAGEADTIVIAGMGGETISAILSCAFWVRDRGVTLILQPMSTQPELRRWLWTNGFSIQRELLAQEEEKLYNILLVRYGDARPLTLAEEWAGRQERDMDQPLRGVYLDGLLDKTARAIRGISQGTREQDLKRLEELQQVHQGLKDMREEWSAWQQ